MSKMFTRDNVLSASSEKGLMAFLFEVARNNHQLTGTHFLETVAKLVNSSERTLFGEQDWVFLNGIEINPAFFRSIRLLCKLIPLLDVKHSDMMQLVSTLVRLSGEDWAATQPNVAFREWCAIDESRVKAVLDDARRGEILAIDHLSLALEAGADSASALEFLNDHSGIKVKMAAATALSRMTLGSEVATKAISSLSDVLIKSQDIQVRNCALLSSFQILEKHPGISRTDANLALKFALNDSSAESLHAVSKLLLMHSKILDNEEVPLVLKILESVGAEQHATLQTIDEAIPDLVREGYFHPLSDLVANLIRTSQGKLRVGSFTCFRKELIEGDRRRLSQVVVKWLLEGNYSLCSSLAELFIVVGEDQLILDLQPSDLPSDPEEQLFLCRKAVGFMFLAPVSTASLLVPILWHGDSGIAEDILALLYNPLLLSYSVELQEYLKDAVEQNSTSSVSQINELLIVKQQAIDALTEIGSLVELHPSEKHRQIESIRFDQVMTQAVQASNKQSIYTDLVTVETVLYGSSASSYIIDSSGEFRSTSMTMKSHSVECEYPQLEIFDPEGLSLMLLTFRLEQRNNL